MLMRGLALMSLALLAPAAEQTERVFHITQGQAPQNVTEAALALRMVVGIRQLFADPEQKTVTVRGTAEQVRTAEWLVGTLDQPAGKAGSQESYGIPGAADEGVRVFRLAHAETPLQMQEISTLLRSLADVNYLYMYSPSRSVVLRGNAWRLGLAEWLLGELDRPASEPTPAGSREYRLQGMDDDEDLVRIYYTGASTQEALERIVTGVRSRVRVPRAYINTARGAFIVRTNAERMAAVDEAMRRVSAP